MKVFVDNVFGKEIAPKYLIKLSNTFLQSASQTQIDSILIPALGLKLKAKPESVIETACQIFMEMNHSLDAKTSTEVNVDVSSDVEGSNALLSSVIKQLTSSKEKYRTFATELLEKFALLGPNALDMVVKAVSSALGLKNAGGSSKGSAVITVTLASSEHRFAAFTVLTNIVLILNQSIISSDSGSVEDNIQERCALKSLEALSGVVFDALVLSLGKQASSSTKE